MMFNGTANHWPGRKNGIGAETPPPVAPPAAIPRGIYDEYTIFTILNNVFSRPKHN
jgi:hypothetical protein